MVPRSSLIPLLKHAAKKQNATRHTWETRSRSDAVPATARGQLHAPPPPLACVQSPPLFPDGLRVRQYTHTRDAI